MKSLKIFFLFSAVIAGLGSCKKIQEDSLINGLWQMTEVKIDTISTNYMNQLPHYPSGNDCCVYKIDFQKDNIVFAYYLTYDTFNYVVAGTWGLTRYNEIHMKFDNYFDGTFDIEKTSAKHFTLTSDENHIKAFDGVNPELDTTFTEIKLERI